MNKIGETVAVHLEDSAFGPTLAVDRDRDEGGIRGVLNSVDRLATLVITAGSSSGTTFIWDPAEVGVSPIR